MFELRPSTLDDASRLCACVGAVARERKYLLAVEGFSVEETRSFLEGLARSGGFQIVAFAGEEIVGWCDVRVAPFEGVRHVGHLGIGIQAPYRGKGLGTRLLREVLTRAIENRLRRVELEVFASNEVAIRLYERMGFELEGRKRKARCLDGVEDDLLVMGLLLKESVQPGTL